MYRIISETDAGLIRDNNQDCLQAGTIGEHTLWAVVCDGMGGASGGKIASETAVQIISKNIVSHYKEEMGLNSIRSVLFTAVSAANAMIYDMAQNDEDLKGMGTSVVAMIISGDTACIAHAGDSRAYKVGRGTLEQITKDHSIVQFLVEQGEITQEEARSHPNKNFITRAVGVQSDIEIDYNEITLADDDKILICTDGLTNCVTDEEIHATLMSEDAQLSARRLVEKANQHGGQDNISVDVITQ